MDIISLPSGQDDIAMHIEKSESILSGLGIELREENFLTAGEVSHIHRISAKHSCLESNNKCYLQDAENGILKLRRGDELLGYIFAHSGIEDGVDYYERGSLWVSSSLAGNGLGKYLMSKMTKRLQGKNILSVTSNTIVQVVNELLMDYEVISPTGILKNMIEVRGEMKPDYRYFVNERLMGLL